MHHQFLFYFIYIMVLYLPSVKYHDLILYGLIVSALFSCSFCVCDTI